MSAVWSPYFLHLLNNKVTIEIMSTYHHHSPTVPPSVTQYTTFNFILFYGSNITDLNIQYYSCSHFFFVFFFLCVLMFYRIDAKKRKFIDLLSYINTLSVFESAFLLLPCDKVLLCLCLTWQKKKKLWKSTSYYITFYDLLLFGVVVVGFYLSFLLVYFQLREDNFSLHISCI